MDNRTSNGPRQASRRAFFSRFDTTLYVLRLAITMRFICFGTILMTAFVL